MELKKNEKLSVGQEAQAVGTTAETLRHYDKIGLVKPSMRDEWTGYRYYSQQDLLRLNTVMALQLMGLSLKSIRDVLSYDRLEDIIAFLEDADRKADERMEKLRNARGKIALAKEDYQRKLSLQKKAGKGQVRELPERTILLSSSLSEPTLENLWSYLGHFYTQLGDAAKDFRFEDMAGVYSDGTTTRLFALCLEHGEAEGLMRIPAGSYLCAQCMEEERVATKERLMALAQSEYGAKPSFCLEIIVVAGILNWDYEVQIPIEGGA